MTKRNLLTSFAIAGILRYLLIVSKYASLIQNRVEVSTPLNSWKRVKEGAFLYNAGINPYIGDMYHENPLILLSSNVLLKYLPATLMPYLFILIDLIVAGLLYRMAKRFLRQMYNKEQNEIKDGKYFEGTEILHYTIDDTTQIPIYVALAYLFNPYSIFNCIGMTTTVWTNLFLAGFFYGLSCKSMLTCLICLTLETQRNFYPFVLIVPAILQLTDKPNTNRWLKGAFVLGTFVSMLAAVNYLGYLIFKDLSFFKASYGFIFFHEDLHPNIGLFWYFFTEMFEHFQGLFLYTFQLNATVLYLFPLSVKLRKQPMLLATILTSLSTIFRSYPCVGDVAFYMALFPLWKRSAKFMANNFFVFCFFLITSALGPCVWYLWIYCNSANANFYFGATLAFCSAQIFLITDLLFASNKREFCLYNGLKVLNKIALE